MAQAQSKHRVIDSQSVVRPATVYSQAVIDGNQIFVAGQAGVDFSTGKIDPVFERQARQAFDNLKAVVEAAGSDMSHVVKVVVWLKRAEDFDKLNELFKEYFPVNPPARSVPVVDLPKPEFLLSIEAIATIK